MGVAWWLVWQENKRKTGQLISRGVDLKREKRERYQAEQARASTETALVDREAWYHLLLERTGDIILVYAITPEGMSGHFTEVSNAACRLLEYSREELLRLSPMEVEVHETATVLQQYVRSQSPVESLADWISGSPDRAAKTESTLDERLLMRRILDQGEARYEREYVTSGGTRIPVEVHAQLFEYQGESLVFSSARDIRERDDARRVARESEERFRDFFDHSPIGIAVYDGARALVSVNSACLRMFGIPDRAAFARFSPFDNPFLPRQAREVLAKGDAARCEMVVDFDEVRNRSMFATTSMGKAHFDMLVNTLGHDREHRPRGYVAQIQDVTQRRTAESALRRIEGQLQQAQKMEAIGTLAGGIAHDFNNILTPILGYAEIARSSVGPDQPLHEYMGEVLKASHRAKELVHQILMFSRQADQDMEHRPVHVVPIVKEALKLVTASAEGVAIQRIIKTEHDVVVGDPTQMHQVIMNLCTNAVYEMRKTGGELGLRMTDFVITRRGRGEFKHLEPGRYLRISVKDTGPGMDDGTVKRVFEPFFTTKERGEGTGMGLSVVHGIVSSLKGVIRVETELGVGSTFHVILPVLENRDTETMTTIEELPRGSESVLFVDDDKVIAKMVERMLATLGYRAVVCTDPDEALRLVAATPDRFDILITDQAMPGMSGAKFRLPDLAGK